MHADVVAMNIDVFGSGRAYWYQSLAYRLYINAYKAYNQVRNLVDSFGVHHLAYTQTATVHRFQDENFVARVAAFGVSQINTGNKCFQFYLPARPSRSSARSV